MKKFIIFFLTISTLSYIKVSAQTELLPIPSQRISSIAPTEFGLIAGEYDTRIWNNPYNGVLASYDKGQTWQNIGVAERGVVDIEYSNKQIYAATYYFVDGTNGLFKTMPSSFSFTHIGPNYSTSEVEIVENHIYLGTYSHGIWISSDNGSTWLQNDQVGGKYATILELQSSENIVIASTEHSSYISYDYGLTFEEIQILAGKRATNMLIDKNIILAISSNNSGMYRSTDYGKTFVKVQDWGTYIGGAFLQFNDQIYTSKLQTTDNKYYLFVSNDKGITWKNMSIIIPQNIISAAKIFSMPSLLYFVCNMTGIVEYQIPVNTVKYYSFLSLPVNTLTPDNYLGRISSYFDHRYPFLGYTYYQEPKENNSTTYNFYGDEQDTNILFYSSHNGIDFIANYSDEVLAAAAGYASYYYCNDCGHSIKINHQNEYQTIYMHLQEDDLITKNQLTWVEKGQKIGKIGLTGRTTGPHLHFQIQIDKNQDGQFNDFPEGNVDPFGWLSEYNPDPWEHYIWTDVLGQHTGSESKYLWEYIPQKISKYIQPNDNKINLNSKSISFNIVTDKFTAFLTDLAAPIIPKGQSNLKFVGNNMTFSLTAVDHLANNIDTFDNEISITLDLSGINLGNILKNTLKLYYYDDMLQLWTPLNSILDLNNNKLTALTNHLSTFALLGESAYSVPPESIITITGEIDGFFYTQYPLIDLAVIDKSSSGISATLYSIDNGLTWNDYSSAFILREDGVINFLYKSIDNLGNTEDTKNSIILINTKNYINDSMKIYENIFTL